MNRIPLWITIVLAAIVALTIGFVCAIAIPQDYTLIKADRPYEDSDLSNYMDEQKFAIPYDMQKLIETNELEAWRGTVYRKLDGTPSYFFVEFLDRTVAEELFNGAIFLESCPIVKMSLVFSYLDKKCKKARWLDNDNRICEKKYNEKTT